MSWYARRASLAAIYAAAELHQIASPNTAHAFLASLLDTSSSVKRSVDDVGLFASYVTRSWAGIIRSAGIF
jgi:ubiquinone biosynthesis protein COQ9